MIRKSLPALLAIAAFAPGAQAGWYAGAMLSESQTSHDLVANRESTVVNASVTGSEFDARDAGYKIFGGYSLTPWLAIEVNASDLGESRLRTSILTSNPPLPGSVYLVRKIKGLGADLVLSTPLGSHASVFGRVGATSSRLEAAAYLTGNIVFTSGNPADRQRVTTVRETVTRFGAGGEWSFNPNVSLRVEWERWLNVGKPFEIGGTGTTGEADTDAYSVGLVYRF